MTIDLSLLAIICSAKVDGPDRVRNVKLLLRYFEVFTRDSQIVVVEQGPHAMLRDCLASTGGAIYHFIESAGAHYKTRNLNLAASLSTRQFLLMLDVDVMIPPEALTQVLQRLESGVDFVAPYNGIAVNIKRESLTDDIDLGALVAELIFFDREHDRKINQSSRGDFQVMFGGSRYASTGGALAARRQSLFAAGGWNTNIVSYGFEDSEMFERISKLGYRVERLSQFNCYHFDHARGLESQYNNYYRSNEAEFRRVQEMQPDALGHYAAMGFKSIDLNPQLDLQTVNNDCEYSMRVSAPTRVSLSGIATIIAIKCLAPKPLKSFESFLDYLEKYFDDYEITIVEVLSRHYKYLSNKKNIRYHWLDHSHALSDAVKLGRDKTVREQVDAFAWDGQVDSEMMMLHYAKILQDSPAIPSNS